MDLKENKEHKLNLVILPLHDWRKCEREGFRTRDGHLMLEFEKNPLIGTILVINRPITLPEMVSKRQWWKIKSGKSIYTKNNICLTQVTPKLFVLDYFCSDILKVLYLKKRWWGNVFQRREVKTAIKNAIDYLKMKNFILFLWNPVCTGIIGSLGEKVFIFDAIDNWLEHKELNYDRVELESGYQKIREKADLIFTNSRSLADFLGEGRDNVTHIPNGVDIDYFYTSEKKALLPDIEKINRPIIGYAGKIQDRIDVDLVNYLIRNLPQASFVFIGQKVNKDTLNALLRHKNIYYLGDKHYSLLPQYLSYFDIGIIPHKISALTASMDPLKLYEYLAAGKPVVTTNIAGVDVFKDVITIARTKEEFLEGIKKYIQELSQDAGLAEKLRKKITPEFCWSSKARKMVDLMITKMKEKE